MGNAFSKASTWLPSWNFNFVKAWWGRNVSKSVSNKLISAKRIVMINLKMDFGPTLKASGSKMDVQRVAPKSFFPVQRLIHLGLTFTKPLQNLPSASRMNAPLAKQTPRKKLVIFGICQNSIGFISQLSTRIFTVSRFWSELFLAFWFYSKSNFVDIHSWLWRSAPFFRFWTPKNLLVWLEFCSTDNLSNDVEFSH